MNHREIAWRLTRMRECGAVVCLQVAPCWWCLQQATAIWKALDQAREDGRNPLPTDPAACHNSDSNVKDGATSNPPEDSPHEV